MFYLDPQKPTEKYSYIHVLYLDPQKPTGKNTLIYLFYCIRQKSHSGRPRRLWRIGSEAEHMPSSGRYRFKGSSRGGRILKFCCRHLKSCFLRNLRWVNGRELQGRHYVLAIKSKKCLEKDKALLSTPP